MSKKKGGWYQESQRHALAAKGVETGHKSSSSKPNYSQSKEKPAPSGTIISEELENVLFMRNPSWSCLFEDEVDRRVHLGLYCEAVDLGATGIDDQLPEDYQVAVFSSIMVVPEELGDKYAEEIIKTSGGDLKKKSDIQAFDAAGWGGGVPVDMESVSSIAKSDVDSVVTEINGDKMRLFKSHDDAQRYVKDVYSKNASAVFGLIGFQLDRRVNGLGDTGWDIISHQAFDTPVGFDRIRGK